MILFKLHIYSLIFNIIHQIFKLVFHLYPSKNIRNKMISAGIVIITINSALVSCNKSSSDSTDNDPKNGKKIAKGEAGDISRKISKIVFLNIIQTFTNREAVNSIRDLPLEEIEGTITNRPDSTYIIKCYVPIDPETDF